MLQVWVRRSKLKVIVGSDMLCYFEIFKNTCCLCDDCNHVWFTEFDIPGEIKGTFAFCCDNLWKSKFMALEPGKLPEFFSATL